MVIINLEKICLNTNLVVQILTRKTNKENTMNSIAIVAFLPNSSIKNNVTKRPAKCDDSMYNLYDSLLIVIIYTALHVFYYYM